MRFYIGILLFTSISCNWASSDLQNYTQGDLEINGFYQDFKFFSENGGNFQQYTGHTNAVRIGGNDIPFKKIFASLHVNQLDTNIDRQAHIESTTMNSNVRIKSHGLDGSFLFKLPKMMRLRVFGGYNQNRFQTKSVFLSDLPTIQQSGAFYQYYGDNEYLGARFQIGYKKNRWHFMTHVDYFASRIHQNSYTINQIEIKPLTTTLHTFVEGIQVGYEAHKNIIPFVSGSLLQVANRHFSRPLFDSTVLLAPLPQTALGNSGYGVGAGMVLKYKRLMLIPRYIYSQRGSPFRSNQAFITFKTFLE